MSLGIIVGKKIRGLREKHGLTQEDLAEKIKTSYKYMQRIEGKTPPDIRLSTIKRLADAFGISPAEILKS